MTFKPSVAAFALTISFALTFSVFRVVGAAQVQASEAAAQAKLRRQALAMLAEVVAEVPGLKLPENRIHIRLKACGLLWESDEPRARALSKAAVDDLVAVIARLDAADPHYHVALDVVTQLRLQMLESVGQRDARLALEFLHATRQPPLVNVNPDLTTPDHELVLAMNLAVQIAAQDPAYALRMAEEGLSRGVTFNTFNVMYQLREKDPAAAAKLASGIARRLHHEDLSRNPEALGVLASLLTSTRAPVSTPPDANANQNTSMVRLDESSHPVLISEQARRELFEMAVTVLLNTPLNRLGHLYGVHQMLKGMVLEAEKAVPARAVALRRRLAEIDRVQTDPRAELWKKYEGVRQGSIEVMLEAATNAPAEMSDSLLVEAAWKAFREHDTARARQIAGKVSNPQQRLHALKTMERQQADHAAAEGRFEAARRVLAQLDSTGERVAFLLHLSQMSVERNDHETAREFLAEAREHIGERAKSYEEFGLLLQIAEAYVAFDPSQSFAIVEPAIDHLNDLIGAAAVVDGFGLQAFVEGEMKPQGAYIWNDLISVCAARLARLARADFDRAQIAAQKFQRPEVRTMTRLLIVQALLEDDDSSAPHYLNDSAFRLSPTKETMPSASRPGE